MNHALLTPADWEQINRLLPTLYRELEPKGHTQALLAVMDACVPDGYIALNHYNVVTGKYYADTLPAGIASAEDLAAMERYLPQSPFVQYHLATGDPRWKTISDFMPVEDFWQTDMHRLGMARIGVNYQICGVLATVNNVAYAITINRKDRGFTERERAILNALHPHLVTSFLNAWAFTEVGSSITRLKSVMDVAPGAYGYINAKGDLVWLQPRAQEWLREFFRSEAQVIAGLPLPLHRWIQAAGTSGRADHLETVTTTDRLVACLVQAVVGGWILRLDRSPLTPIPHFQPLAQLTPRENEVLRWMVEGKRNGEIATILQKSPRTVEKQVQSILAKLAVENRASAIIRAMELTAASAAAV